MNKYICEHCGDEAESENDLFLKCKCFLTLDQMIENLGEEKRKVLSEDLIWQLLAGNRIEREKMSKKYE
ncbi:MAG: hypothetical protein WBF33_10345 [Candidatus Nitrosopolaris sp.]